MNHSQTMDAHPSIFHKTSDKAASPYTMLAIMGVIHFLIMYGVMYTMVDKGGDIFLNLNNVYMTGMMLAPMIVLMPMMMKMMYPNKKLNMWILSASTIVFIAFYGFMRSQTFIGDRQFVRSMIPHHSGAVLMCEKSQLQDAELKALCQKIVQSQKEEIDQMKKIFGRL